MAKRFGAQNGLTLIEVMVAITMVGMLAYWLYPSYAHMLEGASKQESLRRLKDISQTLTAAYRVSAFEIDSEPTNVLMVGGQPVLTNGMAATETTLSFAERFSASSSGLLHRDGFSQPWRYFVSTRLANVVDGDTLFSHKIAIVSAGRNGRIDSGTLFDVATGTLTLKGDDVGAVVDGYDVQSEIHAATKKRLEKLATSYQAYFQTRFQSNANRNLNINYFVSGSRAATDASMFDVGGSVASSGGMEVPAQDLLGPTFGLSDNDFKDGYGNPITLDNSSDAVRTPDNANASMQAPPYTVKLKAQLPGASSVAVAVVGTY